MNIRFLLTKDTERTTNHSASFWHVQTCSVEMTSRAPPKWASKTQAKVCCVSTTLARLRGRRKTAQYWLLCTCAIIPRKTWESVHVWKLSVKSIRICLISSKDVAVCQLNYLHSMNVEDDCRVYEEGKDAFLQLPTSFSKSVCYEVLSFACLSINKAS